VISAAPGGRGTLIEVIVVPGASRSRIAGPHGGALKVQVAAPPERGRANDAVCELLADVLSAPCRAVTVVRGERSRRKTVQVAGIEPVSVRTILAGLAAS
jgi:hypothetical protein